MADIARACQLTDVSRSSIYRYFRAGLLTPYKQGGRTLVSMEELKALVRPARTATAA